MKFFVSYSVVRRHVLSLRVGFVEQAPNVNRLRWFDQVLHIPTEQSFRCVVFSEVDSSKKISPDGQTIARQKA